MAGKTSVPLEFIAHNIELPDGTRTMPDEPLLRDWGTTRSAMRTLQLLLPVTDPATPPQVVDLGCNEGGYAVEFARAGYDVLGIEGRRSNVDKCEFVARQLELSNLRFVHDDVRNIRSYGMFDAVFCCGLLYHLDQPISYLRDMADVTRRVLMLHTHYATPDDETWTTFRLSPMTVHEGSLGRWYAEWDPDLPADEVEALEWSAVGNNASFWPEKRHLLQAMLEAGFPIVCEQYDFLEDIVASDYTDDQHRSFFIGVKLPLDATGAAAPDDLGALREELAGARTALDERTRQLQEREARIDALEEELRSLKESPWRRIRRTRRPGR